jgi:hypothetical protein
VIALDEQVRRQRATPEKPCVPGQEDAAFAPGQTEEIIVLAGEILRVVPQDA